MVQFLDPETEKVTISGPINIKKGSAIFLDPETDKMVQFLAPETDIMGEQNYIAFLLILSPITFSIKGHLNIAC